MILAGLLLITVLLAGVSYAVFNSYTSQNSTNTLAATCIELEFSGEDSINLTNAYPISDSEGLKTSPYKFKIKNKCKNYLEYMVIASVINVTNPLDSKYVKVNLSGDNEMNSVALSSLKSIQTLASLSGYSIKENYVLKDGDGILKDEERNFEFRMWLDGENEETWTSEQVENKNYQVKISVIGTVKTEPKDDLYIAALIDGEESTTFPTTGDYDTNVICTKNGNKINANETLEWNGTKWELALKVSSGNIRCNAEFESPSTWETPSRNTLLVAIKNGNTVKTPITTPGAAASSSTEALLASTADDYGTSYYFRGSVTNNFVEYANMCWRIVRVTGDGSIKLVLYNYNGLTSTNNTPSSSTPCNVTGDELAFLRLNNDDDYYFDFSDSFDANTGTRDNAYIGFMYGDFSEYSTSYLEAHANIKKSRAMKTLEKWYDNILSNQNNFFEFQLADTIWCNDKSVVTDTTFNPKNWTLGTNYGYGRNINYYSATKRLVQASSWTAGGTGPSLICSNDNNGGKLSKFTVSDTKYGNGNLDKKIGLLTADEFSFAGGLVEESGAKSGAMYLIDNANGTYATLSPSQMFVDGLSVVTPNIFIIFGDILISYDAVDTGSQRPSISLKSWVRISSGDGSATSPYKIAV